MSFISALSSHVVTSAMVPCCLSTPYFSHGSHGIPTCCSVVALQIM